MPTNCVACGSDKMIPHVRFFEQAPYSMGRYKAAVDGNPHALIFKDSVDSDVTVSVCGECGYIHFRAKNPERLYRKFQTLP